MELYTRNAVKYSFLLSCIDRVLNYGLKSQQMVLHANLQSETVLTIFTILCVCVGGGGAGGFHVQQLIILKVIMIETRCLQFWNSLVIIFSKDGMLNVYTHYRTYKIKLWPKFIDFIRCNWRYNINDIYNIKVVLMDANNMFSYLFKFLSRFWQ